MQEPKLPEPAAERYLRELEALVHLWRTQKPKFLLLFLICIVACAIGIFWLLKANTVIIGPVANQAPSSTPASNNSPKQVFNASVSQQGVPSVSKQVVDQRANRLENMPSASATGPSENFTPTTQTTQKLPVFKALASSEYRPEYGANKAIDGKAGTGSYLYSWWSRDGETIGAWIDLYVDRPCVVTELAYFMSFDYTRHQIRKARLIFDDNSSQDVHFRKGEGWQRVLLTPAKTERVRVEVEDTFPNGSAQQLQVIELELYGHSCGN